MTLSPQDIAQLEHAATRAARIGADMIRATRPQKVAHKRGGESAASQVVTEVDHAVERAILEELRPTLDAFDLGLLTEERGDEGSRLRKHYHWCVDPIDGTLPFVEGTPGYAVSIALVARDGVPVLGVVADPVREVVYRATRGGGMWRNDAQWSPPNAATVLTVFLDRSARDSAIHGRMVDMLDEAARAWGLDGAVVHDTAGAVMNACYALETPPACYFKLPKPGQGGGSLWDFAATACLYGETGGVATDMAGGPLDLNRADSTFMNHRGVCFATSRRLARRVRDNYAAIRAE